MRRAKIHKRKKSLGNFFAIQKSAIMRKRKSISNTVVEIPKTDENSKLHESAEIVTKVIQLLAFLYIIFVCVDGLLS